MDKIKSRTIKYALFAALGAIMFILSEVLNVIDTFWGGVGIGFAVTSILRLIQIYRYQSNESYAEKIDIQNSDERNRFIAEKAKGLALSCYIIIAAILAMVLRVMNYDNASSVFAYSIIIQILIYCLGYQWLKRKY